ncbi:MAG: Fe2+-dependent dioxygenase [Gammaproteobacteria bacterium]|nr:Fe2+-dependent dioxygenase [Gammaproteobacteria bacterium]
MILEIPDFLGRIDTRRLRRIAAEANFVNGRLTNPHNETKDNQQIDHTVPGYQESSQIVMSALTRHEAVREFAMPNRIAPPLLCKYDVGMAYGAHFDVALLPLPELQSLLRSDLSATLFLNDPDSYDGGELVLQLESRKVPIKLPAGGLVVYPSTMLHEVTEVTRGQRLVAITFIESKIIDERKRHMIYTLGEVSALEGMSMKPENRMLLDLVRHNLIRMWS